MKKTINLVTEKKIQETRPQKTEKVAVLLQPREDKIAVKACCTFKTKRRKNKFGRSKFWYKCYPNFHCLLLSQDACSSPEC